MQGVSVTSHGDDVKMLPLRKFRGIKVHHRIVMF